MVYDPQKLHRQSLRIQGVDYSESGAYFATFVTQNRVCILSKIAASRVLLEPAGEALLMVWKALPKHYRCLSLGDIVIMPNHVHAILFLHPENDLDRTALSEIIRAMKSFSARRINALRATPGTVVWQRNYYEHIIRNQEEFCHFQEYIHSNPLQWELDQENPARASQL